MDEPIIDAAAPVDTTPVDTTPVDTTPVDVTQPLETAATPDFDKLFDDTAPDPNAPVDPAAPVVPPEFAEVMAISPYVKDAQQLTGAVHLADQVIKVQNGEAPISGLLENFRAQNSPAFEKMARESLIPYVEQITGMKLMDPTKAGEGVQKTPEQERIDRIEAQFSQQEQQRQQAAYDGQVRQAQGVLLTAADTALKGTWLEGKGKDLLSQLAPHMGMNEEQATRALLSGNTAMVDKAVKAMMAQKEAEGKAYAKWKIAESRKLKTALPAGPGNPRSGEPELEKMDRAQRIQYLQTSN